MMKKILFFIFICFISTLEAKVVNKIIVLVDNEPITMVDLLAITKNNQMDENVAINTLIQKKIIINTCKKYGIKTDDADINNQLLFIAKKNSLHSIEELEHAIKQQGDDFKEFKNTIAFELNKQKLFNMIASSTKAPTEEEIKNYQPKEFKSYSKEELYDIAYDNKIQNEIKSFLEKEQIKAKIEFIK